jgi:hypothetical protein
VNKGREKVETPKGPARPLLLILFLLAFVLGCGSNDTQAITIVDSRVTAIGLDGEKRSISTAELFDHKTGRPAVKSVLVLDRQSNRQVFIDLDQLPAESPAGARYILVTDG